LRMNTNGSLFPIRCFIPAFNALNTRLECAFAPYDVRSDFDISGDRHDISSLSLRLRRMRWCGPQRR
jgi:hypothetical protein